MQIQNELKEILFNAFCAGANHITSDSNPDFQEWLELYKNKILALGKPEPLAKNKQTENLFLCYQETLNVDNRCEEECVLCRNNRLENECRDAASR